MLTKGNVAHCDGHWILPDVSVNPPGVAQASADSADFSLVTKLRLSKETGTTPAADLSFIISRFKKENTLFISVDQKPSSFVGFVIDGDPTDNGTYWEIPVTGATVGNSALDGELLLFATNATDMQKVNTVDSVNGETGVVVIDGEARCSKMPLSAAFRQS